MPALLCLSLGERFGSVYPPDAVPIIVWDAEPREPTLRPLVEQWYRRDDTVTPPIYRLQREPGRPLSEEDAAAIVRYWEAQGLAGAGDSLTAHEIARGVLEANAPPDHALCYLRAPGLTADPAFPPALVPVFIETDPARQQKLDALKARVRGATDRLTVRDYDPHYAGLTIDPAFVPPDLPDADRAALAKGVVTPKDWLRVSRAPTDRTRTARDGGAHAPGPGRAGGAGDRGSVARDRARAGAAGDARCARARTGLSRAVRHATHRAVSGTDDELARVHQYLANAADREILVVAGAPGTAKSAFLRACVQDARIDHPEALVIPHFIGAAPASASLSATLRALCETLRRDAPVDEAVAEDPDKLRVQLRAFLEQAGARRPIILFVDALDQLDPAGRSNDLDWLPLSAPPGTRIIVSALAGDCLEQLTRRVPADHIVTLPSLPADDRRALITAVLAQRRKRLTDTQLTTLLDAHTRPDAHAPALQARGARGTVSLWPIRVRSTSGWRHCRRHAETLRGGSDATRAGSHATHGGSAVRLAGGRAVRPPRIRGARLAEPRRDVSAPPMHQRSLDDVRLGLFCRGVGDAFRAAEFDHCEPCPVPGAKRRRGSGRVGRGVADGAGVTALPAARNAHIYGRTRRTVPATSPCTEGPKSQAGKVSLMLKIGRRRDLSEPQPASG